ncbi:methyl-accepting chemotaxis protein [Nitrogeniibacter aestuarii]|uniref:methyl-accepting chemotaxis protein n=1 Tax=Nitrogeniibacter aestuarii TaxID=2815343 RepID=UPI001E49278B|nr:methyl-accepting chemotaxis protein [Nitrogeniibacter aestuarii]
MKMLFMPAVAMLNRLRYTTKFMLICVITTLVCSVLLAQIYIQGSAEISRGKNEIVGVAALKDVMGVLGLMQQHRGMTSGMKGGDAALAPKVAAKAEAVDAAIAKIDATLAGDAAQFGLDESWAQIKREWTPLKAGQPDALKANFDAHSSMITKVIKLMVDISDASYLSADSNVSSSNMIDVLAVQAPQMTERLGRLRGYGTGLVAKGVLDDGDYDRLHDQLSKLELTKDTLLARLKHAANAAPGLSVSLTKAVEDVEDGYVKLRTMADEQILQRRFSVEPSAFFAVGTEAISGLVKHLDDTVRPGLVDLISERQRAEQINLMILMTVSAISAMAVIYLMVGMYYSIVGSVQELSAGAQRLASGDYTSRVEFSAQDELAEVANQFNDMAGSLRNIIAQVKHTSTDLSKAAAQMSKSADEVATASERQSDSASGMAAAVEEMTVGIDEISRNASAAAEHSERSGTLASEGGNVVRQSVQEMERIADSVNQTASVIRALGEQSGRISTIVNAISEIAEQTNLLALNAAIEAARAGESGRGFAVVADEVRKLAERTATATHEITDMVEAIQTGTEKAVVTMESGVEQVREGVDLTKRAGQSMDEINNGARSVVDFVSDISHALREQSSASTDIARNVEAIAQMAESNSHAVRGAARTAAELERMSATLRDEVSRFRV